MGELQLGGHWNKRIKWIVGMEMGLREERRKELGLRAFEWWCGSLVYCTLPNVYKGNHNKFFQ